jgi:hypothetical protein
MDEHEETDRDLLEYLLQDSGINQEEDEQVEVDDSFDRHDRATVARELTRSKRLKARRTSNVNPGVRGVSDRGGPWCTKNRNNSKNAIAARENRQKKKMYLQGLEEMNSQLTQENSQLRKESAQAKKKINDLEGEVQYLRKVLFNQSALAGLLKKMNQSDLRLGSFNSSKSQPEEASSSSSGGVCLHVNGEEASLKFCASCARQDQP